MTKVQRTGALVTLLFALAACNSSKGGGGNGGGGAAATGGATGSGGASSGSGGGATTGGTGTSTGSTGATGSSSSTGATGSSSSTGATGSSSSTGSGMQMPPYPPPPYGLSVGSTLENYPYIGYVDPKTDNTTAQSIQLSDFYNPTGADVYPPGSPYGAGKPRPKVLVIIVSAMWSGPDNNMAKTVLPPKHAMYEPMGGEFLLLLDDSPSPGVRATLKDLTSWTGKYAIDYPSAVDPSLSLFPALPQSAYPGLILVRTKDMKISAAQVGVPDQTFWTKFEAALAAP